MRMRIQDLSGWLDLTYRRPKIDDLWSSSDDGSRVSQPSAQVRTLSPPIFKSSRILQLYMYGQVTHRPQIRDRRWDKSCRKLFC